MATSYPVTVLYCGNCGLPPEFCEYGVEFERCKPWLKAHAAHLYPQLFASPAAAAAAGASAGAEGDASSAAVDGVASSVAGLQLKEAPAGGAVDDGSDDEDGDGKKKKSRRGGVVVRGGPKKKTAAGGAVVITKKDRGRRKYVTTIAGLDNFDVKLKEAASALGKKFGAGASVVKSPEGKDMIDVQGDVLYDLPEVLAALFNIPEDAIICKE